MNVLFYSVSNFINIDAYVGLSVCSLVFIRIVACKFLYALNNISDNQ
jgi:hypothetical protein